jgi:DNA repair protein RecN (Recombination protein N)
MLRHLSVHNYAIIDHVEIDFENGFNVITGETGAGKSILLGALGLILGERAEQKSFFDASKKCVIEGWFTLNNKAFIEQKLRTEEVDVWDECCMRREITADGRSRAFINDCPVKLSLLKEIGDELIDIHSQHQTLLLKEHNFQLDLLDGFAENNALLDAYRPIFKKYKSVQTQLKELQSNSEQADKEYQFKAFQLKELHEAKLNSADELEVLEAELKELENAESTILKVNKAIYLFNEHEQSILAQLKEIVQEFGVFKDYSEQFSKLLERSSSSFIEIKDLSDELNHIKDKLFIDEEKLIQVKERVNTLNQLILKNRLSNLQELIDLQEELDTFLGNTQSSADQIQYLQNELQKLEKELDTLAENLHINRTKATQGLSSESLGYLKELGMPNASLTIEITKEQEFNAYGKDKVRFMFSANAGHQVRPIESAASGGELSRLMFVLKGIAANYSALPSIIFDEIDTGISGEVAKQMGAMMQVFSKNLQVIAISHLPQIAAKGKKHFFVYKQTEEDISRTKIKVLEGEHRVQHIAQMISGNTVSDAGIQSAKELLEL